MMAARDGAAGGTSSARWRRERRQRSWVATRAAERRSCPHLGSSPQRWSWSGDAARGAAGGGGARDVRRPTGTEHSTSGDAAGAVACSSGAAGGSHGRLRGCRGSFARRGAGGGARRARRCNSQFLLQQSLLALAAEEGGEGGFQAEGSWRSRSRCRSSRCWRS